MLTADHQHDDSLTWSATQTAVVTGLNKSWVYDHPRLLGGEKAGRQWVFYPCCVWLGLEREEQRKQTRQEMKELGIA